jgi:hypothetical protein
MSHSGPANGAGEAARRLRHNGQYVARLQDIVNKCHDRIQLLTEGSLAEVGGSADELKQAVLAWGQTVLAPELLIQLRVKAHSPIASRLEALAKEVDNLDLGQPMNWPVRDRYAHAFAKTCELSC